MFSRLSFEIRLLIWEAVLHQPRIVHINMRYLPDDKGKWCASNEHDDGPEFECLSSTPVPVLLHLCTETRILALAHYKLTLGRANALVYSPRRLHHWRFSVKGEEYVTVLEGNEAEVAKYAPKIYFNFQYDTVVFGRTLPSREEARRGSFDCFPYHQHFDIKLLQRIKNLALSIDAVSDTNTTYWRAFWYLDHHIGSGRSMRLKRVYLCLEADGLNPSRGIELLHLGKKVLEDGDDRIAHVFVDRWGSAFGHDGLAVDGVGMEVVRNICRDGLNNRQQLRESLKNSTSPDEVLKCVWVRNTRRVDGIS